MLRAVVIACCLGFVASAPADEVKPANAADEFGEKVILLVYTKTSENPKGGYGGGYLEKVKVRKLGDRYFLVGRVPDMGDGYDSIKGTVTWMPIVDVMGIREYENLNAAKKAHKENLERAKTTTPVAVPSAARGG